MAGSTYDSLTVEQKLRLTLCKDVQAICKEAAGILNLEFHQHAIDLIGELAFHRLQLYGLDLEHFAGHAKRCIINAEDAKLLVRRNETLKTHITNMVSTKKESKKRKTANTTNTAPQIKKIVDNNTSKSRKSSPRKKGSEIVDIVDLS